MLRFLKSEVAESSSKNIAQVDVQNTDLQLANSSMKIGEQTRRIPSTLQLNQQKILLRGMRTFFQSAGKYLLHIFPLGIYLLVT